MNLKNMSSRTRNIVFIIALFVIVTLFYIIRGGGPAITPVAEETRFTISITEKKETVYTYSVDYKDIDTLQVIELDDKGELIQGESNKNYTYGTFKNDKYGEYTICGLTKLKTYMEIRTVDGKYFLSNFENKDTTTEFCRALREYISKKK